VVSKVAGSNGLHIIHLREVIPPFILLEPPFVIHQSSSTSSIAQTIDSILDKVYEMNKDNDDMFKLFVVLPNPTSEWKSGNLFENEYVLHFVCECSTNEMHFACHPAYTVPNSRVFFQIYGQYMKQFMVSLARHLFDHQTIDKYHDARFWSEYKNNLDKLVQVLDVAEHELGTVKKASDTSELKDLIMSDRFHEYSLCRSITPELNVRWVCMNHYPVDQIKLIHELNDIENVVLDINESSFKFTGEIDSAKTSHICDIFTRGFRLYCVKLSKLKISASSLQRLTRTLSQASLITIYYDHYAMMKPSDSEKLEIESLSKSCNEIIASNPRLKNVNISVGGKDSERNDAMIGTLKSNQSLRSLKYGLQMTSKDVTQLISMIEKSQIFTTLELAQHALPCESVQTIAALIRSSRTLINLTLSSTKIMNEGMQMIVDAICVNPIMRNLKVWRNELSDESVPLITHLLQTCSSLTSLDVSSNNITVLGARLIFEELETNRTLLHFYIDYNNLSVDHARKTTKYTGSIIIVGDLIARMLLKNTTLCTLDISAIGVSDNELRPLAQSLTKNRTLAHLTLGRDRYSSVSCKQIGDVLHWNCSLIELDLDFSALDEVGVQKLSEILQRNNKLRYMNLSQCDIRNNKISILAEALNYNRALTHLNLSLNGSTSVCAEVLAHMLRINKSITHIDIGFNQIGNDGVKAIADALFDNHTLIYIGMESNKITDIGGQAIIDALESNGTLLHLDIIGGNKLSFSILTKLRSIRRNLNIT
jgi:Ran GTPase-activating protein (RanGAP) involved in mRNA processing and transport